MYGGDQKKPTQPSNQAHDTYQMRLKIPNDMGYKKALCNSWEDSMLCNYRCRVIVGASLCF